MRKLRKVEAVLCHVENVGVDVDIVYSEWVYSENLLELDFCVAEI